MSMDFPGKNTGVGCHFLLQGVFLTQGSNSCLLHQQEASLLLSHLGIPICIHMCVCAKSLQSCPTLCDPVDYSLPGSSVLGILQARILEWVAMLSSRGNLPNPRIEPESLMSPTLAGGFFTTEATWEAHVYIYPLLFRLFSHVGHYRVLSSLCSTKGWKVSFLNLVFSPPFSMACPALGTRSANGDRSQMIGRPLPCPTEMPFR